MPKGGLAGRPSGCCPQNWGEANYYYYNIIIITVLMRKRTEKSICRHYIASKNKKRNLNVTLPVANRGTLSKRDSSSSEHRDTELTVGVVNDNIVFVMICTPYYYGVINIQTLCMYVDQGYGYLFLDVQDFDITGPPRF